MIDIAEIIGKETVATVVDDFYNRVRLHPALSVPFSIVADWDEHKAHLTHFWWITLGGAPYRDKPYQVAAKHAMVGFTTPLLQNWLALFRQTLDAHLPEDLAAQWYARADKIGTSLQLMHEFIGWRYRQDAPAADGQDTPSENS